MPIKNRHDFGALVSEARIWLEQAELLGVRELPTLASPSVSEFERVVDSSADSGGRETLEMVREDLGDCQRCPLCDHRKKIVFGVGNPRARLVLVGEAPGRQEDLQGEPFVGEAGRLLDRILLSMGTCREDVYLCDVQKCRPPGNRDPEPEEIAACEPFLQRQLAALKPDIILALGRFSAQTLLRNDTPISRLRGNWYSYQGIPLMPTYHPAYLLRNPAGKREVWEDVKQVMQRLRADE